MTTKHQLPSHLPVAGIGGTENLKAAFSLGQMKSGGQQGLRKKWREMKNKRELKVPKPIRISHSKALQFTKEFRAHREKEATQQQAEKIIESPTKLDESWQNDNDSDTPLPLDTGSITELSTATQTFLFKYSVLMAIRKPDVQSIMFQLFNMEFPDKSDQEIILLTEMFICWIMAQPEIISQLTKFLCTCPFDHSEENPL